MLVWSGTVEVRALKESVSEAAGSLGGPPAASVQRPAGIATGSQHERR